VRQRLTSFPFSTLPLQHGGTTAELLITARSFVSLPLACRAAFRPPLSSSACLAALSISFSFVVPTSTADACGIAGLDEGGGFRRRRPRGMTAMLIFGGGLTEDGAFCLQRPTLGCGLVALLTPSPCQPQLEARVCNRTLLRL